MIKIYSNYITNKADAGVNGGIWENAMFVHSPQLGWGLNNTCDTSSIITCDTTTKTKLGPKASCVWGWVEGLAYVTMSLQKRDIKPMLLQWRASVVYSGPTLKWHWILWGRPTRNACVHVCDFARHPSLHHDTLTNKYFNFGPSSARLAKH